MSTEYVVITGLVGLACSVLGIIISYSVFHRNSKKEASTEGKAAGVMLTDLGYIKSSVDEIKAAQKAQEKGHTEVLIKQAMFERDLKTAFSKIEELQKDIDMYHAK